MFQQSIKRFYKKTIFGLCLAAAVVLLFTACSGGGGGSDSGGGGGGGGNDVAALSLPNRIELSNTQDTAPAGTSRSLSAIVRSASRGVYSDTGTDYINAVKRSWVKDTDALDMINTVLGICKDTGYDQFVNQGAYKALVRSPDESKQSQSGSSTTSETTEELAEIYVDVTRASNSAPMIVMIWLLVNGPGDNPMLVRGYFSVTEGVSGDYPFGAMVANFKGNMLDENGVESPSDPIMQMALSVSAENGQVIIENVDDEGVPGVQEQHRYVRVVANADATEGNAYVSKQETNHDTGLLPDPTVSKIAFNADYFKATPIDEEGTIIGDSAIFAKAQLSHRVFRYQLFDASTGAAVTRNSGFPIEYDVVTDTGTVTKNGYVGYYGLWTNNNISLASGTEVRKMDGTPYTVFKADGKLTKHTSNNMPLSALNGVELSKNSCDENGCNDYIVTWSGANFVKLGIRNQMNGQITYYVDGDPGYQETVNFQQWEGAYCESLKAYLRLGSLYIDNDFDYSTPPIAPTDASTVYYHTEKTIAPSDAAALDGVPLYTWSFTIADLGDAENLSVANQQYWASQSEKTFYFNPSTMMLADAAVNGTPATIPAELADDSYLQWGYHIGPLTVAQYAPENSWQANNADTYYTWNTGTEQWNQYITVIDSNDAFEDFDPPISFSYTHATNNDVNYAGTETPSPFDGKTFRIEYDGFSVNIPWAFDASSSEWTPLINIADGTTIGTYTDEEEVEHTCVIKGLEEALIMSTTSDTPTFTEEYVGAPTLEYDATKTALVTDVPINVDLKVIKGEVIE